MTLRRLDIDRIVLTLQGVPVAQAELLAAQLQAAMAAQPWPLAPEAASPLASGTATPPEGEAATLDIPSRLAGPALVQVVAARLMAMAGSALDVRTPSQAGPDALSDPGMAGAAQEAPSWP